MGAACSRATPALRVCAVGMGFRVFRYQTESPRWEQLGFQGDASARARACCGDGLQGWLGHQTESLRWEQLVSRATPAPRARCVPRDGWAETRTLGYFSVCCLLGVHKNALVLTFLSHFSTLREEDCTRWMV